VHWVHRQVVFFNFRRRFLPVPPQKKWYTSLIVIMTGVVTHSIVFRYFLAKTIQLRMSPGVYSLKTFTQLTSINSKGSRIIL
jgi:hypothetical protein